MRKLLNTISFLTVLLLISSCASSTKAITLNIDTVSKVIKTNDDKNELYLKANDWMVRNFVNAESVIQFSDKEAGIITGKYLMGKSLVPIGSSHTFSPSYENVFSIIKIQVKENAAKISITPNPYSNGTITISGKTDEGYSMDKATKDIDLLISSFIEFMKTENDDF